MDDFLRAWGVVGLIVVGFVLGFACGIWFWFTSWSNALGGY